MALDKIKSLSGQGVYVPGSDIDTDRIIPARFMKCVTFDGLGDYLFYDVRKNEDGSDREHPLNEKRFKSANILVSGMNFGCGSSREHAPQALYRYGFRGVIAESFAEIFFGNCTTLGMPCVTATHDDIVALTNAIEANPEMEIRIDLEKERVFFGDENFTVHVPDTAKEALTSGKWDPIGELIEGSAATDKLVAGLSYMKPR